MPATQTIYLPSSLPDVSWDSRRGRFSTPAQAEAQRRYDQLLLATPAIVQFPRIPLRDRLRRLTRNLRLAKAVFLDRPA